MAAIAAGVGAMLCISSSVAAVMMGGGEETPAATGAGTGAVAKTHSTPVLGKIYHTDVKRGCRDSRVAFRCLCRPRI
jgi:hypothetical protein